MVKHFVYVTTDISTGKFYIGKHNSTNEHDSYVGSGVWVKNCKKSGIKLTKTIVANCQSENDAYKFEKTLVFALRKKYPNLCMNFADGGRGSIASTMVGRPAPMLGKKHNDETKHKIAEWGKINKVKEKHHFFGKFHSETSKQKMSLSHKKIAHLKGKKVLCKDKNIVFNSLADAARFANGNEDSRHNIRSCCNGKTKTAYGHKWQFVY